MKRYPDWPRRLYAHLQTSAQLPFAWGVHDCALFACAGVAALTGIDPAAGLRGTYTSRFGATSVVLREAGGFENLVERLAARHDMKEVPPKRAQRGDLVLFDSQDGPALGQVHLDGVHVFSAAPDGLALVPLALCRRAWRVG